MSRVYDTHESTSTAAEHIPLPQPRTGGGMPLNDALAGRRSQREFTPRPLSLDQVSQLCWAAQGVTSAEGRRTCPSAGALYGVSLFLVDAGGVYEYEERSHALLRMRDGDVRRPLQSAALDQECVGSAPGCAVIALNIGRMASKYGSRAERYCLLEAGHAGQNLLLAATAMDLGSVAVGAFDDRRVAEVLNLPDHLRPVYLFPVGHLQTIARP